MSSLTSFFKELGYREQTTFCSDFDIAEAFGIEAVKDTFKRAFEEWKDNYVYITELAMVMNHKCWYHFQMGRFELSKLYAEYYHKANDYAYSNLKGEELNYYFTTTD